MDIARAREIVEENLGLMKRKNKDYSGGKMKFKNNRGKETAKAEVREWEGKFSKEELIAITLEIVDIVIWNEDGGTSDETYLKYKDEILELIKES